IGLGGDISLAAYHKSIIRIGHDYINNFGLNPEACVFPVAHEFRHAWQDSKGVLGRQLGLSASDNIVLYNVIEADAVAFMITVCNELCEAGINGPLNYLLGSDYGLFASEFLNSVEEKNSSPKSGRAQRNAFMAYLRDRRFSRNYASAACENFSDYRTKDNLRFTFRPVSNLSHVNRILSEMPFYDDDGTLMQRPAYDITPRTPREIDLMTDLPGADIVSKVKHLDRHKPPRPIR
ncbi:MAG: DUF6782 family putative metallopeptidase, partial [Pseudomonadota bacterium]